MKKIYATLVALLAVTASFAQTSVGVHGGSARSHTDATPSKNRATFGINARHELSSYLALGANLNFGQLRGGDLSESNSMSYTNNFAQADLGLRFYPLGLLNGKMNSGLAYLSKIYGGIGIGVLKSNTRINDQLPSGSFSFIQDHKGTDLVFPAEFGIELPLGTIDNDPRFHLDIYYRFFFMNTDKMDGYVPNLSSNKNNDAFSSFGIGISYDLCRKKSGKAQVEETPNFQD